MSETEFILDGVARAFAPLVAALEGLIGWVQVVALLLGLNLMGTLALLARSRNK